MNVQSIVVALVVLLGLAVAVTACIKNRKKCGRSCCGCNCCDKNRKNR